MCDGLFLVPENHQFLMQEKISFPQALAESSKFSLSLAEIPVDFGLMCEVVCNGTIDLFERARREAVHDASRCHAIQEGLAHRIQSNPRAGDPIRPVDLCDVALAHTLMPFGALM